MGVVIEPREMCVKLRVDKVGAMPFDGIGARADGMEICANAYAGARVIGLAIKALIALGTHEQHSEQQRRMFLVA